MRNQKDEMKKIKRDSIHVVIEKLESKEEPVHSLVLGGSSFFRKDRVLADKAKDIERLVAAIRNNTTLKELTILPLGRHAGVTFGFASEIGPALKDHPSLELLTFNLLVPAERRSLDDTTEKAVMAYLRSLAGNAKIKFFVLKTQHGSSLLLEQLGLLLQAKTSLQGIHLDLGLQNGRLLSAEIMTPFLIDLCQNKALEELQLRGIPLDQQGIGFLIEQIEGSTCLRKFALNNGVEVPISAAAIGELLGFLRQQERLEELDLSDNSLSTAANEMLCCHLPNLPALQRLFISFKANEFDAFVNQVKGIALPPHFSELSIDMSQSYASDPSQQQSSSIGKTIDPICDLISTVPLKKLGLRLDAAPEVSFFDKLSEILATTKHQLEEIIFYSWIPDDCFTKIVAILDQNPKMQILCVKGAEANHLVYGVIEVTNDRNRRNRRPKDLPLPEEKTAHVSQLLKKRKSQSQVAEETPSKAQSGSLSSTALLTSMHGFLSSPNDEALSFTQEQANEVEPEMSASLSLVYGGMGTAE